MNCMCETCYLCASAEWYTSTIDVASIFPSSRFLKLVILLNISTEADKKRGMFPRKYQQLDGIFNWSSTPRNVVAHCLFFAQLTVKVRRFLVVIPISRTFLPHGE